MQDIDLGAIWHPFATFGEDRDSRWLIICDHASNIVPPWVDGGTLGLGPEDMGRHIAYDVGAAGVSLRLGDMLGAPVVLSNYSRLVIDPNRGLDDPTLVMRIYDQSIVPGNRRISDLDIAERVEACYRPYDDEVARIASRREDTVIISIHSFTPQLRGRPPRPWHIGLLFANDARLSIPLARELEACGDLCIGLNEPYSGALHGDTLDRHAVRQGRQHTLLEVRNDLIAHDAGQEAWAARLAAALPPALAAADPERIGEIA